MEAAPKIFNIEESKATDYMYMLLTAQVRDEYKSQLPAVTHVDGSTRVQTVSKGSNHKFWSLINKFGDLTGLPVVVNTSFNIKGQPIVCSVEDALETFDMASLDLLVMDNCLVGKRIR
jgi:carbamoyltransferase